MSAIFIMGSSHNTLLVRKIRLPISPRLTRFALLQSSRRITNLKVLPYEGALSKERMLDVFLMYFDEKQKC